MSDTKYTYAVARIRALEVSLFSSSTIEQLIACKDHESCLRFLTEHGWGGVDVPLNADAILTREQEKIWETIREMQVDMDVFDVLSYPNWFHNLKAAVKEVCTGKSGANIYFEGTPISKEEMTRIIRDGSCRIHSRKRPRRCRCDHRRCGIHIRDNSHCIPGNAVLSSAL